MSARVVLLAVLCVGTGCPGQQPLTVDKLDRFAEDHLRKHIDETVASASIVFVNESGVRLEKSLGYARPANRILADPRQTVYQVGFEFEAVCHRGGPGYKESLLPADHHGAVAYPHQWSRGQKAGPHAAV